MLVSEFSFELPSELIATKPACPRDASRLLFINGDKLSDKNVRDFPSLLKEGDLLIFNDTKVIPAKLVGNEGRGKVTVNLNKEIEPGVWEVLAKPARKLDVGGKFKVADDFFADVVKKDGGEVVLKFNVSGADFFEKLNKYGHIPLPPYIKREGGLANSEDNQNYQTIFASKDGAVAAPTAGLHFTEELLSEIKNRGVKIAFVTLHVGAGTFLPIKVEDTKDHKMHSEYCIISSEVAEIINDTKKSGGRVIPVGTTSLRTIESAALTDGTIKEFFGETDIFITPGYKFKITDALFTNFHLPESTLFMLVSALGGTENLKKAYKHAIDKKYRFYSYGDACFIAQ